MNFKKMMKRGQEGFTLVELIVVIAILGILGGIAVPAYSGYVEKANKGADQALIGEVQHALALYYYSNPDADLSTAWVKLNQEGTPAEAVDNGAGDLAMKAVFGDDWKNAVGLKYADWQGDSSSMSYSESSYYGHEDELIGKVDGLTTALGNVIEQTYDTNMGNALLNEGFKDFLNTNKVNQDGKSIGNAAVLYVAQNMQGKDTAIQNAFTAGIQNFQDNGGDVVDKVFSELMNTGIGTAASVAAIYAYAEGYAQATGQAANFNPNFSTVGTTEGATSTEVAQEAVTALKSSLYNLKQTDIEGQKYAGFADYVANQGQKDLQGYIDMMGTIHENQNVISGNLNASDCFTDGAVSNMLKGHAAMGSMSVTNPDGTVSVGLTTGDGQVAVGLAVDANGAVLTPVTPINWNK